MWLWGWSQQRASVAAHAAHEWGDDPFLAGYRGAIALQGDEGAREIVLARQAWSWSPERLAAFLLGHELATRVSRRTCSHCPIHEDVKRMRSATEQTCN